MSDSSSGLADRIVIEVRCNEYTGREPNPNVPFSAEEIAADAAACRDAGASIVHFHARHRHSGAPAWEPADYAEVVTAVRARTDVLLNPTLGASTIPDPAVRVAHIPVLSADPSTRPDLAPVDLGSFNIDPYDPTSRSFRNEDLTYVTSVAGLRHEIDTIRGAKVAVQAVLWNVGSARVLGAFRDMGVLPSTVLAQITLSDGWLSAHPGTARGLATMVEFLPADGGVHWSASLYGGDLLALLPTVLELGGNVSIGLGDHHYAARRGADGRWPTNADLVAEVVRAAKAVGRRPATPDEVRSLLGRD